MTATATLNTGDTRDVTAEATWSSSDTVVAQVSSGRVTAATAGNATITASIEDASARADVTVTAVPTLSLADASVQVPLGSGHLFTATLTYGDGTTEDVTDSALWTSSDLQVAYMGADSDGYAIAMAEGVATITASIEVNGEQLTAMASFEAY